jgi:hypothetical protein
VAPVAESYSVCVFPHEHAIQSLDKKTIGKIKMDEHGRDSIASEQCANEVKKTDRPSKRPPTKPFPFARPAQSKFKMRFIVWINGLKKGSKKGTKEGSMERVKGSDKGKVNGKEG